MPKPASKKAVDTVTVQLTPYQLEIVTNLSSEMAAGKKAEQRLTELVNVIGESHGVEPGTKQIRIQGKTLLFLSPDTKLEAVQ